MLTAFIPMIAATVVSTSAGVAIDSAVKMIVPIGIKALPAFGIKLGTVVASGLVSLQLKKMIESNVTDIILELNPAEQDEPVQEDN